MTIEDVAISTRAIDVPCGWARMLIRSKFMPNTDAISVGGMNSIVTTVMILSVSF